MQSSEIEKPPLHVAIIMDGNGRWANRRGLPRVAGHRVGAKAVRRIVEAAPTCGVTVLTLYAFSADNWHRPSTEVSLLMRLFRDYLYREQPRMIRNGIRLNVIGRRDRLPAAVRLAIDEAESATAAGQAMLLRVAVDYSAREAIRMAAERTQPGDTPEEFAKRLGEVTHGVAPAPDVDLVIRTSGEQRLSDFLLWESAYAELYFTPQLWPDFDRVDLEAAITEFRNRHRRFGRVSEPIAG